MASAYADYTFQTGVLAGFGFGAGIRYNAALACITSGCCQYISPRIVTATASCRC